MEPSADDLSALSESLRLLAARGTRRRWPKGAVLIEEGTFGDTIYIVIAGRVKAYSIDERGREIVYGIHSAGDYFGEMSLDGGPRSASVATLAPTTCVVLTRRSIQEHIAAHPAFAFELIARVIRRARLATLSARALALLTAYARLAQLLDELAVSQPDGTRRIGEPLTHKAIAGRIGASRPMVTRLMKDLVAGGYVVESNDIITLKGRLPSRW